MITAIAYNYYTNPLNITAEGLQQIKERIMQLKARRLEIGETLRSLGSQQSTVASIEESSWQSTLEALHATESELDKLNAILAKAKIVEHPSDMQSVSLGSKVTLQHGGKQLVCTLVSSIEANPSEGKISNESPLGQVLLHKHAGDNIVLNATGRKNYEYKILDIS